MQVIKALVKQCGMKWGMQGRMAFGAKCHIANQSIKELSGVNGLPNKAKT
jgi:hypothetical protein